LATFLATGQRLWLLELLDGASLWLFLPLPVALVVGAAYRRGKLMLAGTVAALFALSFWGWLFIPRTSPAHARGETLTVMTYNLLGPQEHNAAVLQVLRAEHPDVVLFQELNPQVAAAI
jgi:endonuclease/exonuclease/phosphatase (EEP) superfamily protein YafD